jgi:hypothetical protein
MGHVALGSAAHGKFHHEDGQAHEKQKEKIDAKEYGSAVFTSDIGKTPNVTKAYSASCGEKDKAEPAGELLTLSHKIYL